MVEVRFEPGPPSCPAPPDVFPLAFGSPLNMHFFSPSFETYLFPRSSRRLATLRPARRESRPLHSDAPQTSLAGQPGRARCV